MLNAISMDLATVVFATIVLKKRGLHKAPCDLKEANSWVKMTKFGIETGKTEREYPAASRPLCCGTCHVFAIGVRLARKCPRGAPEG
jgi:hypothetical protein